MLDCQIRHSVNAIIPPPLSPLPGWGFQRKDAAPFEAFPNYTAVRPQRKRDLLVKRGWAMRKDQGLDFHVPAIQVRL